MAGTLGLVFRREGRYFGVSNNHVLSGDNCTTFGRIIQPGRIDGGQRGIDDIGCLMRGVPIKFCQLPNQIPPDFNRVDAALMEFSPDSEADVREIPLTGSIGRFWDPPCTEWEVTKVGRTTGLTRGVISGIGVGPMYLEYGPNRFAWFDEQISIEGVGGKCFSDKGDSGSLVVDDGLWGVGLIFADNSGEGRTSDFVSYANPILAVLEGLRINFLLDDNV